MSLWRTFASPPTYVLLGGLGTLIFLKSLKYFSDVDDPDIITSPLKTRIPHLSKDEIDQLPYPPNALPGARDVDTPYGTIRLYEWGPENGKKVLFLHGISTPCISCKGIAERLVGEAGARVMLIGQSLPRETIATWYYLTYLDLFGRGYSDCPTQVKHDLQLYTSQILLAISSSPVPWTGKGNEFTLVGYSLGGGIVSAFASYFLDRISHVVTIAPAGLMRNDRISWKSHVLYGTEGILPETLVRWMVGRRLGKGQPIVSKVKSPEKPKARRQLGGRRTREMDGMIEDDGDAEDAESGSAESGVFAPNEQPILGNRYPDSTETFVTKWQLEHQQGFIPAFINCIRHAPIYGQLCYFTRLANAFDEWNANHEARKKKMLLVLGRNDPVVLQREMLPDMEEHLGKRNLEVLVLDAGHEVPIAKADEIARRIQSFWIETGWETVIV